MSNETPGVDGAILDGINFDVIVNRVRQPPWPPEDEAEMTGRGPYGF